MSSVLRSSVPPRNFSFLRFYTYPSLPTQHVATHKSKGSKTRPADVQTPPTDATMIISPVCLHPVTRLHHPAGQNPSKTRFGFPPSSPLPQTTTKTHRTQNPRPAASSNGNISLPRRHDRFHPLAPTQDRDARQKSYRLSPAQPGAVGEVGVA